MLLRRCVKLLLKMLEKCKMNRTLLVEEGRSVSQRAKLLALKVDKDPAPSFRSLFSTLCWHNLTK